MRGATPRGLSGFLIRAFVCGGVAPRVAARKDRNGFLHEVCHLADFLVWHAIQESLRERLPLDALLFDCPPFTCTKEPLPQIASVIVRGVQTLPLRFAASV